MNENVMPATADRTGESNTRKSQPRSTSFTMEDTEILERLSKSSVNLTDTTKKESISALKEDSRVYR